MFMSPHKRDRHPGNPLFVSRLKGIIFDCDGVLFDSLCSNAQYYNSIRARLGLGPMDAEQERYVHAHTVNESLAHIVPQKLWPELDSVRKDVDYRSEILPLLTTEPGLFKLLGWLRDQGLKLAIATNRTSTMDMVTERFGFHQYFSPIVNASMVQGKPHPEGLNLILSQWGVDAGQTAFIGDTSVDQDAASAVGMAFWAYQSPGLSAQHHIESFWALKLWLQTWLTSAGWGTYHYGR